MFRKAKLKRQIKNLQKQIEAVEKKRIRSQAALVEAILTHTTPSDSDTGFFNKYTEEINMLRDKMRDVQIILEKL